MLYGLKMAHLSCTDDSDERLAKAGENNTFEAVRWIVGGDPEKARRPLSDILSEDFGLTLDCWMDVAGWKHGRAVDTQGFIASNDDTIVVSFRFTTSQMDWLTNLSMTTSEWEPDRDAEIGHAGHCSCVDGCVSSVISNGKPRVHTGFYNNFMHVIPLLQKHVVEPLTQPNATPKTIYICGCSLGAAIATMAFCYVLLEVPLENLDHKLRAVTAGCPRVCDAKMQQVVKERLEELRPDDKAVLCRVVYNQDLVPHIPFDCMGFYHLDKLVYITADGEVMVNPKMPEFASWTEVSQVVQSFQKKDNPGAVSKGLKPEEGKEEEQPSNKSQFEQECETTPGPIKDHMPYWYLTFLDKLKQREDAGEV